MIELKIVFSQGVPDINFWKDGEKYKTLYFWSNEEEELFVHPDDPVPETLGAWAKFDIIEGIGVQQKHELTLRGNGLRQSEKEKLEEVVDQFQNALATQTNICIECSKILDSKEWDTVVE